MAAPLRVALVTDWFLPRLGGIELQVEALARYLQTAGDSVEVITPVPGPAHSNGIAVRRLFADQPNSGYRFPPPPSAENFGDALYLLELFVRRPGKGPISRLREALGTGGYDIAHIHLGNTPFAYLAVNVALELGLPTLATFHSVLAPFEMPFAAGAARLLGMNRWAGRVDLTTVSRAAAEARRFMTGNTPLAIIPNGVDETLWSRVRSERRANPPSVNGTINLVSTMRLHARKRPLALIEAAGVLGRRPGADFRVQIAGDGPLRPALQARIKELGLGGKVELYGQLSRDGVAELLRTAHLFVMPSRLEAFNLAALEARLGGVPVLSMKQSGATGFLDPGLNSLLVGSDAEMTAALLQFAQDASLRKRLLVHSLEPAKGFGWDAVGTHWRLRYRAAISRQQTSRPAQHASSG